MWQDVAVPGELTLVAGRRLELFLQELAHEALHAGPEAVLWCDGAHSFHPDVFAELNLVNGRQADDGAERMLVKRCMTPFQWDSTLTRHLDEKLAATPTRLVLVHPFDTLWSHEEIQDWEQEDYTRFSLAHLKGLARRFGVPIVLGADMARWWRTHPVLAGATVAASDRQWTAQAIEGRWRLQREQDGHVLDPHLRRRVTLLDFIEPTPVPIERPLAVPPPMRPLANERRPYATDRSA